MRAFELTYKENMRSLPPEQRQFAAAMVVQEVQRIAKEQGIDEESAYWAYRRGLYGADREVAYKV